MKEKKFFDRSNPLFRIISTILLVAFIAQDISWADPQISINKNPAGDKLAAATFLRSEKAVDKVSAKAIEYAIEEYSAIPRDKLDLACVRASLRSLLDKNRKWLAPHVSYSLMSHDGLLMGDDAPDSNIAEVVVKFAPGYSVRYFDPAIARPQKGLALYGSPVAINDRLHKQFLTSPDPSRNGPSNFSFGEGVGLRHMEVNNIIAFHTLTTAKKGKYYEKEFYEREIGGETDPSYNAKIRKAADLLMLRSGVLFAKGAIYAIAAIAPMILLTFYSFVVYGDLSLLLTYICGKKAHKLFKSAREYYRRSKSIRDDTAIILVDIPSHLLLSGKGEDNAPFYQLTHIGRARRIIYMPKKALRDLDISNPRDMRQLATILNHDQVELDLMHKDNRIANVTTYQEYEHLLTAFHDTAKAEDPFGEAARLEERIAEWIQTNGSGVAILKKEIDEKIQELEARSSNILDADESKTENRFSYIYDTACIAMQIGYAYEVIGDAESARVYYGKAWLNFFEVVSTDVFILPIYAQLNIVRINTFEGNYADAAMDFKRITNYEIGVPHPHTKYVKGSVRVVERHVAENIVRWKDEVEALMLTHAQTKGGADDMEKARVAIKDITEATEKYLKEQAVFEERERSRASYSALVEDLRRAILEGKKYAAATLLERLRERFEGTLPEEVERMVRETKSPTAAMIPDADALSNYIYELEKGEEILKDAAQYEKKILRPLFDLFFSYLKKDFDGADEFIDYCRATISASDAYELRMQMNEKNKELLNKFSKIREKDGTEDASIELYGLLLFYLTLNSTPYLRHLYREFINTRPLDEIAFARKGISYHTRGDAIVYFYPKNLLFEGREAKTREDYRYGEAGKLEDAKDSPNAQKIIRAIELWKNAAEDKPHLAQRIEHFETITSIVELDMKTSLLFSDPQHNVVRPVHAGRSRHRLYLSKNYLDNLDLHKDSDMKELAAWLNYGQNFLDTHDQMTADGYAIPRIQKALSKITYMFFDDEDTGLLSPRDLRERLASFMEEDFFIKYRDVLLAAIKEEKEAEVLMQGFVEPGKATPHEYKLARNSFGHLLYRYEGLGLHSKADKAYMQMAIVTSVVQAHEGGITPCADQIELVLTALRFAKWDDFLKELRTLLTGKGYSRLIEMSELPLLKFMLKGRFQNDLRHAIHAQKEAADPYSYHIVEKVEKEADKLLKEFSEHPFKDLGPQDVQNTTATLSFIGKAFDIRYSPFFHAPVIEEIAKVGVPFGMLAVLNAVTTAFPALNTSIFAGVMTVFGIIFIIAHLLNERAPPRSFGEAVRLFAAPSAAALAGGILSYIFFTNPLYAILSSVLAHLAINVVVWIARRSDIDIKYSTILFPGAQRLAWAEMEQIRELSRKWGLNENGRKNLEDILKDPGAENIRRALFELLEGGTSSALSRFEMFKEKERGAKSEFLGELVQAASCQRRVRSSKVLEMGPILAGAEIDAVIEVNHARYSSKNDGNRIYDLPEGMYLMEGKVDEWGDVEYFISYMYETKLSRYLRAAQALKKTGKEVSGIIFAVGGDIAKANVEEFRKVFIETGETDDEIRAAGFDPEKFKVYIHLVPETIYEQGPKTALTVKDIEYIDAVLRKPKEDLSISREIVGECRKILERALLLFGLERVRSVRAPAHFRDRGIHLVGRSYDMHEYVKAILDLKRDIAEVEKDTTLAMDSAFIVQDEDAPLFDGERTDRIKSPSLLKADFTLGQKAWGNFEMFISKDRKTVYVSSVERGMSEYFSLTMDMAAPQPLVYHAGDKHVALDAVLPAASVGEGRTINMARIIGILREAIGFREEVLKHDRSDYYWIDRLSGPSMALVSYDILAFHKQPHLMGLVGPHAVIPDFYALDEENKLELLAEFGRHSPVVLGKKFAHGYHALVSIPRGRTPDNEKFDVAQELVLSASMPDRYIKNDRQFARSAQVLAEQFLARLKELAEEEDVRMPVPRSVAVEDSYANRKVVFTINVRTKEITGVSDVSTVGTISGRGLKGLFADSEKVIVERTGMVGVSKIPPSKLLRYGYAKVLGFNGNFVIAPVEDTVQRPMPKNWIMDLPFTSKKVSFDNVDAKREELIGHVLHTNVRFEKVDSRSTSRHISAFHEFLEAHDLAIMDQLGTYDIREILSDKDAVESVLGGVRWVAMHDTTQENAYFFILMSQERIIGHGRFRIMPGYDDVVEFMFYIAPDARGKGQSSGKQILRSIMANIYHKLGRNVSLFRVPEMSRYDTGREGDRYQDIIASGTPVFFVRAGFSPALLSVKQEKRADLKSAAKYVRGLRQGEMISDDFPFRYTNMVLAQAPLLLAVPNMGKHPGPDKGRIEKQDEAISATNDSPTGMIGWLWNRIIPYLRSKGVSARWIASIGGIEELFFSGVMISGFAGLAHMFAMPFLTGLYIGFAASAILFTLAHIKEVYRLTGGVLTHAPPSRSDIAFIAGLEIGFRAVYLAGLILLPFGSFNIIIALPLTIALHSLYNAFIAPRLSLILGMASVSSDKPFKELPKLNSSITKDTSALIKQLAKSFGSSYLIMNSIRNLKAGLIKYGHVKRASVESCDLGIKRILATWHISDTKKRTLASAHKRIVKILAKMDKMDELISRIELSPSGVPEFSAASGLSVCAIRLESIIEGIREEDVHLIQRLEGIDASIHAMVAGREEIQTDKLHSYVRALKAISGHQGVGDKSCARISRLADDMSAVLAGIRGLAPASQYSGSEQLQASLFDAEDIGLIDRLWEDLLPQNELGRELIIGKLESKFGQTQTGDLQIIKAGSSFEIDEHVSSQLSQYAKSLGVEDDKELYITMSTISTALQNMQQHGDNYGAMILRARYISGKLDIQFVLLDRGQGFIDRQDKHVPIHEAVKVGKSFGKNGNGGIGLSILVEVADKISITSVNSSLGASEAYYWKKGDAYESSLGSAPVERGLKTVFVKEIELSVESAKGAYATSFEGRGLPKLSDLSFSQIQALSKDDIVSLIKIIEGQNDPGKVFDSIFDQSSTPEGKKLKATFLYMLRLSRANDKFKQLLLRALRSPPYGMDSTKGVVSSNLEIPSIIFAISKNIPADSARYFDPETGQAVIVFNERFFNIDGFVRDPELSDTVLHVRAERLLHELSHDNTIGPLSKEVAEEAKIIASVDVPLFEVTRDIGMQAKIDRLLKNRRVNRALHHSGRIFTLFPQWLKEKHNLSSREFNIWLHIVRRRPLVKTAGPLYGKAFPALSGDESLFKAIRERLIEKAGLAEGVVRKITDDDIRQLIELAAEGSGLSNTEKTKRVSAVLSRFSIGRENSRKVLKVVSVALGTEPSGTQSFDIVKWYFEEYRASQAEMVESFRDGALSGDDIIDWVDRVIRPIKADFDITGIVEAGKPFAHLKAGLLGEKVLKEILIPHGLIVHESAVASGIAAGLIVETEMITTPAGRTIPLYTVRTLEGDFGQGTAFAEYIIMPEEVARESRDIASYYAKMWRDYQEKRKPAALFRYKKEYTEWIFMHLLGRTDANAASRLVRECDLTEEISHSDMHAFAEFVLARQIDMAMPEDVEAASHAILRPTSSQELAFEAARDPETRHTLAEAVLEVEAKLNAIIRSPMSAYNFLELLHGNIIDLHISAEEPPEYGVARNILLSVLSEHLFGHRTTDAREWRDYLDESLWHIDEFNTALRNAAEAAYREEFLNPDERTKKITEGNVRRQQTAFFRQMYREIVKPRFAPAGTKVLNICSGSNALAILYATNCSEAVMIDRLPFGYRARMPRGTTERIERERYFTDIAVYDFPRTDTIGGIDALWYPLKWELAEMGIAEDALTVDNPASGMWRVRFTWQHPDDSQARERTVWFFEEDIPEAYGVADLAMVGRLDEQGVNVLDADILFDKAAEHTLQVTTELPLSMKRKSIVITDNPLRKKIFDTQDFLASLPLSPDLAEQSRYFGYVGKNTYDTQDALDVMAVYEIRGTGSGVSGKSIKIYNSAVLTDEERDEVARFVVQEGQAISTIYPDDEAHALEVGRAYLDKLTGKSEGGESGYFVVFRGGKPVGIASYAILPEWLAADTEYDSTIDDLYVAENARHQGIAVALVRQAEMYLRKKNVKNYYVIVGQGTLSQDFWKKFIPKEYQTLDGGGALLSSIVPFENAREISRLEACISAVKTGAFQKGNMIDLRNIPPGKEIILVGDLHARLDNLGKIFEHKDPQTGKSVHEKIRDREAVLILLGDVIHNDPPLTDDIEAGAKHLASMDDSLEIMKKVMDLKTLYPDSVYYVLGNHDDPFTTCIRGGIDQSKIYRETIRSRYSERYLDLYRELIRASPVMVIAGGLVATHAAPIRKLSLEEIVAADKDATEMHFGMWGRHESHFGDLEDIFGRANPLLEMLFRSRKEQSYAAKDVGEFLERVGQGQGIFIVGHTPDLIQEGNFYAEIEDRHYIIYAACDNAGYASYKNGELTFVPVAGQDPSDRPATGGDDIMPPEKIEAIEQVSVPVSQRDSVDKLVSFIKLKQELKTRFARLAQSGISAESVADVLDEKSVDIFQAMWELKNVTAAPNASDDSAQEDICYEVSLAACEAFDEAMPGHEVSLVSGYYSEDGPEPYRTPHFWVLIDDDIVIDLTYGQFDSDYENTALAIRNSALSRFKLEKEKAIPWKSVISGQVSAAAVISSIHDAVKVDASKQSASKIILSTSLFDDIDRSNLERLFSGSNIEIVEPDELKRRTMNEHSSKENLAIVLTREDFNRGKTWSGAEEDYRVKSSVLILGDKLTGSNYLYLEGVIELAKAMMRSDKNGIKEYYKLISGIALSDEVLDKLKDAPNTIAFAINAILKFRPIQVHDTIELEKYKSMVEGYLVAA